MRFRKSNKATTLGLLATVPMFTDCDRHDLDLVDRAGTQVDVDAGRVLCREGDIGHECFIVLSGHAHVTIDDRRVSTVGRGGLIGEIALLSPSSRRVATVIAQSPMSLFVVGRGEFRGFVRVTPGLTERLLYAISERLTDNLAQARTNGGSPPRVFAASRYWGDDRRAIAAPTPMPTVRNAGQPSH
jgi:CRP-like cAMP-binding protein